MRSLCMNPLKMIKSLFTSAPRFAPRECADRIRAGEALLVDVREPGEWAEGVAERAVLLTFSDLTGRRQQWQPFLAEKTGRELLFYCASGGRSALAARILAAEGFRTANTGSLSDWAAAGWPVVKPGNQRR
jgi:rhodanese-related sulfurtransferase